MPPTDEIVSAAGLDPDPTLSTTQVGELFEVHPSTVKRWCERGELEFHRTEGGHRRIRLSEALRRGPGGAVAGQLAAFEIEAGSVWVAEQTAVQNDDFGPARDLAGTWLRNKDFSRIRDFLLYLGRVHPVLLPRLLDGFVRDVMREVGRRWEQGHLGVGSEHLASEKILEALFQLRRELALPLAPNPLGAVALVGCAEGERHALGSHCLRLVLEQGGWEVRFLGPDVPIDAWSDLQREYAARLVCISFSSIRARGDVLRTVDRLAATYDPRLPYALALGGGMVASEEGGDRGEAESAPPGELSGLSDPPPFRAVGAFPGTAEFMTWVSSGEWSDA